jgi:DNA-binding MarR family transcriptional regulator
MKSATKSAYLEAVARVERLHRKLLDLISDEFSRMGWDDINAVQALLLFNIGASSPLTASELRSRGCYLGTNSSYNVKKLVEGMYLVQTASHGDRRAIRISLTPKGEEVAEVVDELYERHLSSIDQSKTVTSETIVGLNSSLFELERFWAELGVQQV